MSDQTPSRMNAIVQRRYGGPEQMSLDEIVVPTPGSDQVLIRVAAAGIDRGTWHLMTGLPRLVRLGFGLRGPKNPVPGLDVAGRVVAVGSDVAHFSVGDDVFGIADGSLAEYAVADESKLSLRPESVPVDQAGVAAVSGITALQALTDVGRLEAGQKVLVMGAAGGVGSYATQIAAALGAEVTGVASTPKLDLVRRLGAARVIDYTSSDPLDGSATYDLIVDTGGGRRVRDLRRALEADGTLVIVGAEGGGDWTGGIGRQARAMLLSPFVGQRLTAFISKEDHEPMDRLGELMARGEVQPAIDRTYGLADVPQAMRDLAEGRIAGKAAVRVSG